MKPTDHNQMQECEERRLRGRPRLRPDEETRALIFEAAQHEFSEKGYAATSMETVARRAGVSTKTLYRLIANKAALFEAMVAHRADRVLSAVNLSACEHQDIEVALRAALRICGELALDPEVIALQRMIIGESDAFPDIAATFYHTAIRRTAGALAGFLTLQQKRGRIRLDDPDEAASMLLGMMILEPQRAAWFARKPLPDRDAIAARAARCAALFLRGARTKPA